MLVALAERALRGTQGQGADRGDPSGGRASNGYPALGPQEERVAFMERVCVTRYERPSMRMYRLVRFPDHPTKSAPRIGRGVPVSQNVGSCPGELHERARRPAGPPAQTFGKSAAVRAPERQPWTPSNSSPAAMTSRPRRVSSRSAASSGSVHCSSADRRSERRQRCGSSATEPARVSAVSSACPGSEPVGPPRCASSPGRPGR